MGLFSRHKKPDEFEAMRIRHEIDELKARYKWICQTDDIGAFLTGTGLMKKDIENLLAYERKYPTFFTQKPSDAWSKILAERGDVEKDFIDRYIMSVERKLLDYSTMRGKTNNFNKKVDLFRYYSGDFCPESVEYFEQLLRERFPEFI